VESIFALFASLSTSVLTSPSKLYLIIIIFIDYNSKMLLRNNKLQEKVRKSSNFLKQLFSKFTDQCILWNVYYTVAGNIYLSYLRSHTNLYWPLAIYTTSTRSRTPTYLLTYQLPGTSYQGLPTYLPTYTTTDWCTQKHMSAWRTTAAQTSAETLTPCDANGRSSLQT